MLSLFQSFEAFYNAGIANAIQATINQVLVAVQPWLVSLSTLYIIGLGILLSFRRVDGYDLVAQAARLWFVNVLLAPNVFGQWIQDPLLHAIPDSLGAAIGAASGVAPTANAFDMLNQRVQGQGAIILQGVPIYDIASRAEVWVIGTLSTLALIIAWSIFQLQKFLLNLTVALIPITLMLSLIKPMREVLGRNLGKAFGLIITIVLIQLMMNFYINANTSFATQGIATGFGGGADAVATKIWSLTVITDFFFLSLFLLLAIPTIGTYIGGGVLISAAPVIMSVARIALNAGRGF